MLALVVVICGAAGWGAAGRGTEGWGLAGCMSARPVTRNVTHDATLGSLINSIDRGKLEPIVNDLTGVTSPVINGSHFTIRTRFATSGKSGDMAERYVYERLRSYGLSTVRYQSFAVDGVRYRNVVGEIAGKEHANQIVVVGAHLDSKSGEQSATLAPGADDNASGVAAALCIAKAFAGRRFDRTVRFVFFDGEEVGHHGAKHYADRARATGERIVAMFAADMLAHNDGSDVLGLHTRASDTAGGSADEALAQTCITVARTYAISGVEPTLMPDGNPASDHAAFWEAGYPAIMIVQDFAQFDSRRHTTEDTISHFVWPYYVGAVRVLLGTVASGAAGAQGVVGRAPCLSDRRELLSVLGRDRPSAVHLCLPVCATDGVHPRRGALPRGL